MTSTDVISLPWEELYQRASKGYRVKEWGSWVGAERIIALTFTTTSIPIVLEAFFDEFLDKALSAFFLYAMVMCSQAYGSTTDCSGRKSRDCSQVLAKGIKEFYHLSFVRAPFRTAEGCKVRGPKVLTSNNSGHCFQNIFSPRCPRKENSSSGPDQQSGVPASTPHGSPFSPVSCPPLGHSQAHFSFLSLLCT